MFLLHFDGLDKALDVFQGDIGGDAVAEVDDESAQFHSVAKQALDPFDPSIYPQFAANAKEYFFIPHRKKERGVGGIFFDHYNTGNFAIDLALWKQVGDTFLETVIPIYKRRTQTESTPEEKEKQLEMRAHYVEFNLLYDRGTKFGFQSGGNPEAILCSMPPPRQMVNPIATCSDLKHL